MFFLAISFKSDLSGWDVSKGTDFVSSNRCILFCFPFLYLSFTPPIMSAGLLFFSLFVVFQIYIFIEINVQICILIQL